MERPDVDGLNSGYAALLLEQYLDNPSAVPEEWRDLFESEPEVLLRRQPGLARLLERAAADGGGHAAPAAPSVPPAPPAPEPSAPDKELLGGVAASMSLVKAIRMHGHLAAHLGHQCDGVRVVKRAGHPHHIHACDLRRVVG